MKKLSLIFIWLAANLVMLSCSDDGEQENQAPVIADQTITAPEDIDDERSIGTVQAFDNDRDELSFSITENSENLFRISEMSGVLSLSVGEQLDFETQSVHSITVQVTDGIEVAEAIITIEVEDIQDLPFITTWVTTVPGDSIVIYTNSELTYNYSVEWGDGNISLSQTGDLTHTYSTAGRYSVSINGAFPAIVNGVDGSNAMKLLTIESWGDIKWESMMNAFEGCINLTLATTEAPVLTNVTATSSMFERTRLFNQDIGNWDVSNVSDMVGMFNGASAFNQDIGNWDVGNVGAMNAMFNGASSFNQDIGNWNTSNVRSFSGMFLNASAFNQDIGNWDVGSAIFMNSMFSRASSFNQDLSEWEVSEVVNCSEFRDFSALENSNLPPFTNCTPE